MKPSFLSFLKMFWGACLASTLSAAPLVVQLDWRFNAQFAGLLVASERGYYRDAKLDVEIRALGQLPYDQLGATVAKTPGMIGSIEGGLLLSNLAAGEKLVAIGTMFQASPLGLITLTASGIRQPTDLKGKRVLIHADGREGLAALFHQHGMAMTDARVAEGGYGMADLLAGECDAKQGYLVDELVKLRLDGHSAQAFAYRDFGYRAYSQVYIVSEETYRTHRAELIRFLIASAKGWAEASRDPAKTADLLHRVFAPDLPKDYLAASLQEIIPLLTAEQERLGSMRRSTWEAQKEVFGTLMPGATLPPLETWLQDLTELHP